MKMEGRRFGKLENPILRGTGAGLTEVGEDGMIIASKQLKMAIII